MLAPWASGRRRPRIAIVGAGTNPIKRLFPALMEINGRFDVRVFEVRPVRGLPFPCDVVSDDPGALTRALEVGCFDAVIIEAPAVTHPSLIRAALNAGTPLVICEKPIALTMTEGEEVVRLCRAAEPRQMVRVLDHYLGLGLTQRLLGVVRSGELGSSGALSLELTLHEDKAISEHEIAEHRPGMGAFLHHGIAFMCAVFPEAELIPVDAQVARHPAAPKEVADTYRAAVFEDGTTHQELARVSAGKYFAVARRQFGVRGPLGSAVLDRVAEQLRVKFRDAVEVAIGGAARDLGYRSTLAALAERRIPEWLLTPQASLRVLNLVEEAEGRASPAVIYDDVVVDWQMLTA